MEPELPALRPRSPRAATSSGHIDEGRPRPGQLQGVDRRRRRGHGAGGRVAHGAARRRDRHPSDGRRGRGHAHRVRRSRLRQHHQAGHRDGSAWAPGRGILAPPPSDGRCAKRHRGGRARLHLRHRAARRRASAARCAFSGVRGGDRRGAGLRRLAPRARHRQQFVHGRRHRSADGARRAIHGCRGQADSGGCARPRFGAERRPHRAARSARRCRGRAHRRDESAARR